MKRAAVSIAVVFVSLLSSAVVFAAPAEKTDESGWGEAVDGFQVRLRADKIVWASGEQPTFKADVRNVGKRELLVWQTCLVNCEIELDGVWYRLVEVGGLDVKSSHLPPGRGYEDIPVNLGGTAWASATTHKPLRFHIGKHVVRVAVTAWPAEPDKGKRVRAISNAVEITIEDTALGCQARRVAPLIGWPGFRMSGLDELMEMFEKETVLDPREAADFEAYERRARAYFGGQARPEWMKDTEYYRALDTRQLAEECVSHVPFFVFHVAVYSDPRYGILRLKAEHPGFDELFKRKDMWRGILHANEYLSSRFEHEEDEGKAASCAEALGTLRYLYVLPPLKEQVQGKERLFLASTLRVLSALKRRIEDAKGKVFIYPEPAWVSQVALMLAKRVDPQRYARVEPAIRSVRFTEEQRNEDLVGFITLVIDTLEGFVPEEAGRGMSPVKPGAPVNPP